jgi:hypothetical protein
MAEMRGKKRFARFVDSLHFHCKQVLPKVYVQRCLRLKFDCTLVSFMTLSQDETKALFHLVREELKNQMRQRKWSIHELTSDLHKAIEAGDDAVSDELLNAIDELNHPIFASEEEDLTEIITINDSDSDSSNEDIPSPRMLRSATKSMAASATLIGRELLCGDISCEKPANIPSRRSTRMHMVVTKTSSSSSDDTSKKRPAAASSAKLSRRKQRINSTNNSSSDIERSCAASKPKNNAMMQAAASALLSLPHKKPNPAVGNAISPVVSSLVARVKTLDTFAVDLQFSAKNSNDARDWLLHALGQAHHGGHPFCRNSK